MKTLMRCIVLAIALLAVSSGHAQVATQKTVADLFKTLKVGQWLELQGTPQADMLYAAKKVKLLTGDFQDDDWEIKGVVKSVNPASKQFTVYRIPVTVTPDCVYESPDGTFTAFDKLRTGILVECEGTYLKDGKFLAEEVQHETDYKPAELNELAVVGKVEKFDAAKRTVTIMGSTFRIADTTKIQSVVK